MIISRVPKKDETFSTNINIYTIIMVPDYGNGIIISSIPLNLFPSDAEAYGTCGSYLLFESQLVAISPILLALHHWKLIRACVDTNPVEVRVIYRQ